MANIAVFGGTFNPFHIGHYEILKSLCANSLFDKVLVVPDRVPPHKKARFDVRDDDRIEMCRLACKDFKKAQLCLIEFEREGKSYTYDTVIELKEVYPSDTFFIACGADMIKTLDTWYRFDELKDLVKFVAFNRGNDLRFSNDVDRMRSLGAKIIVFDETITNISSSFLRENFDQKLLPKKVCDYVNKRGIYKLKGN